MIVRAVLIRSCTADRFCLTGMGRRMGAAGWYLDGFSRPAFEVTLKIQDGTPEDAVTQTIADSGYIVENFRTLPEGVWEGLSEEAHRQRTMRANDDAGHLLN